MAMTSAVEKREQRTERPTLGRVVTAGKQAGELDRGLALWGKAFQAEGTIGAEALRLEIALRKE